MADAPAVSLSSLRFCRHALRRSCKSPQPAGVATIDDQNLSVCWGEQRANPLHDARIQDRAARSFLSVGEPGIHVRRVQDLLEHRCTLADKQPLSNQRVDHRSAGMNVPDVGSIVHVPNFMGLPSDPDQDACVLRLRMRVQ